ncbi:cyclohexyl-isocyanide hydratase [Verrucomicrobium sp. GAS474]|uniref:DJ-1/PfpI family protein n=1 Tax=Verrucomicrobium sp. GAS474 TaxID=1882831 RepID=UPI000879D38E|nr:DJ-1/PfpI family protein [Verrucomicrobium sp. GAS474]SDT95199.1 cyclohexyl-isocyanide hydratase [Verrucomicrobium sp. GAS474]
MSQHPPDPLTIVGLVFPKIEQLDFTGPFGVLARLPQSTFHIVGKTGEPVADSRGFILTPNCSYASAPPADILLLPGGPGQNALMEDEETLDFIRRQAAGAKYVFTVCTGALLLGAAGLLKGVRATTHWAFLDTLKYYGAIPVDERTVIDGAVVSAAGITAGIDAGLQVAALLRGERVAKGIQLGMAYSPQPPFRSGTPSEAPPEIVEHYRTAMAGIIAERREIAERIAKRLGVAV